MLIIHSKSRESSVGSEDHTNYQLFIVCYCCVYRSLIIFGGQPQRYGSAEWKRSFEAFHFSAVPY